MDRLSALQLFVRVVDSGSFSQAARDLGVGQPTVSKQIAALEERLGAQLLSRTTRGLRPTASGLDFYDAAQRVLRDLAEAEGSVSSGNEQTSGMVRVAVPPMLASLLIVPRLLDFYARFPAISIELVVSERHSDLVQEGIDLAVRIGRMSNSGLVARKIGSLDFATVVSPDYLATNGVPRTPEDLHRHHLIAHRYLGASVSWTFGDDDEHAITPTGRFSSNNPADMVVAVVAGLGIAQGPRRLFEAEIGSARLVEILADRRSPARPIYAVHAVDRVPRRARIVSDFIASCLESTPAGNFEQGHS
ncbi:transcriptional regulator, LysR family [Devosia sp. YR412]|uniref:LysR family transcriptional regulator n=1 Tax=Devosia sp. YR412 TaxID=1881030 RepID=UPI0008BD0FBD|nr:LysR family transcriptional regulator [Devosia sp. YR412]SEP62048.1 transcriptional regulator, LysR family [Devosia sp. YR412]